MAFILPNWQNKNNRLYTQVRHKQEKRNRMINLLQENIEIKSLHTNYTFGFCQNTSQPEKTKRVISLPTLFIISIFAI